MHLYEIVTAALLENSCSADESRQMIHKSGSNYCYETANSNCLVEHLAARGRLSVYW